MDGTTPVKTLHPLSPLTADELAHAIAIVRRELPDGAAAMFENIELAEPDKAAVRGWAPGGLMTREASINAYFRGRAGVTISAGGRA